MVVRALPEPISLAQQAACLRARPGLAWLDGDAPHADGRWSFLAVEPREQVRVRGGEAAPLAAVDRITRDTAALDEGAPPVAGAPAPAEVPRWIGYVAYDAHHGARLPADRSVLCFSRYDALLCVRHDDGRSFVVGDGAEACARLLASCAEARPAAAPRAQISELEVTSAAQHRRAITTALEHIAAGEIYQVNLARRWSAAFGGEPLALTLALRAASPVPLGFHFDDGERSVIARTMERFLRHDRASGSLLTRPIKGTIARSGGADSLEASRLTADPKERAEHAMIVDLMRNDLGRVAQPGSVRVGPLMAVEPFAGLSHLVSEVRCQVVEGSTARGILEATFPPGSVTGAPKLRAIDIIAALEAHPRDVYTGAVGFVDRAGGLSLAVAIRTAIVDADRLRYWAGGGIVEASDPDREVAETELKARVLHDAVRALGCADLSLSSQQDLRYMRRRVG